MIKTVLPYAIPAASAFAAWLFSFIYYKAERKNDLSVKLIDQIEDLANKYSEISKKYVDLQVEFCKLKKENAKLKQAILTLKPDFDKMEGRQQ